MMKKILLIVIAIFFAVFLYKKHQQNVVGERIAKHTVENSFYLYDDIKNSDNVSVDVDSYEIDRVGDSLFVNVVADVHYENGKTKSCKKLKVYSSGKFGHIPDSSDVIGDCS
jgi:hypothetical protein